MIEQFYNNSPILLQNIMTSIKGLYLNNYRYGGDFNNIFKETINRVKLSEGELQKYREGMLRSFFKIALTSPYWMNKFKNYEINTNADDIFGEVEKLPLLSKDEVKKYSNDIRARIIPNKKVTAIRTSGTSGNTLIYYNTRNSIQKSWAVSWRFWKWNGIDFQSKSGIFSGKQIVPLSQTNPPFHRFNIPGRQILFSVYHLRSESIKYYIDALIKNKIYWIGGYASAISLLAHLMFENSCPNIPSLKIITTASETLLSNQRKMIEEAFNVPVREKYGQAESVASISECEYSKLHVDEDYSFVEFIPLKNDYYKIIGTNWSNPAFPLFRYDTGDIATLSNENCSCGKFGRIVKQIDGRIDDYVILPSGVKIGRLSHVFKKNFSIREAQIYQPDRRQIIIRVVKGENYDNSLDEKLLLNEAKKWIGNNIEIKIEYVNDIEKTQSGKLRLVVSDVKE